MIWDFPDHREAYGSAGKISLLAVGTQSAHKNEFLKDTNHTNQVSKVTKVSRMRITTTATICWTIIRARRYTKYFM